MFFPQSNAKAGAVVKVDAAVDAASYQKILEVFRRYHGKVDLTEAICIVSGGAV